MASKPLVSVVLTSHTADRITDTLELLACLGSQTYPRVETIFVIERCEELRQRVQTHMQDTHMLDSRVLTNDGQPGASASRNIGIRHAAGDIIAFLDVDALPEADWAEEMAKTHEDSSVIGVTGPAVPLWHVGSVADWFPEEFYWIVGGTAWGDWDGISDIRNVWTQNASFKREAFELADLFDTKIGPHGGSMAGRAMDISEDVEISLRVRMATGKRIVYNPRVQVRHRVYKERLRLGFIARWSFWVGYSKHKLKKLYPTISDNPLTEEHRLLKRIVFRLLPSIAKMFLTRPVAAWRKLQLTLVVMPIVALGYGCHVVASLVSLKKEGYQR